jgi:DNA-binding transcriptional LysR family regulator
MTHTIDDYDLMLRMVAAGLGVGFVPELALSFSDTKAVALRTPVGVPPLRRRIHALTRATLAASPMVRALLSALA